MRSTCRMMGASIGCAGNNCRIQIISSVAPMYVAAAPLAPQRDDAPRAMATSRNGKTAALAKKNAGACWAFGSMMYSVNSVASMRISRPPV